VFILNDFLKISFIIFTYRHKYIKFIWLTLDGLWFPLT
jgi:hypothetical protein